MNPWQTRWRRAQRYGFGQAWRAGIAYRMHDAAVAGRTPSRWSGRLLGFGQHPDLLPTAVPGVTSGWDIEQVSPGHIVDVPVPRVWADDGVGLRKLDMPDVPPAGTLGVRRLIVREATIQPGQSLVVTAEAALVPELLDRVSLGPGVWEPGPATCLSPWRNRGATYTLPQDADERMRTSTVTLWRASDAADALPVGISLFETVDDHFGHAMLDLLHRLRAVGDLPLEWPVLVSDRMPENVVAWIGLICPGRPIIRCRPGRVLAVGTLVVPLESARLWQRPCFASSIPAPATIDPEGMRWLQGLGALPSRDRHRRVWIRRDRSPHSAIIGEPELVEIARTWGFEDVFLQDLTLADARALLGESSHVIAPMASAVANTVLASPGLRILQFTDAVTELDRYGSLTWLPRVGHEAGLIVGRPTSRGYRVSAEALVSGIAWLLQDA